MKRLYLLLLMALAQTNAQNLVFPDANLKAILLSSSATNLIAMNASDNYIAIDANHDGEIQQSEAAQVRYLGLSNYYGNLPMIQSVEGIAQFTNLRSLNVDHHNLQALNLNGMSSLQYIDCTFNNLTSVDLGGLFFLQNFDCSHNQLTSLTLQSFSIYYLGCANNNLTTLNINNLSSLQSLNCTNNQLTALNLVGSPSIKYLECGANQLSSLNLSANTQLLSVKCPSNELTSLNITGLSSMYLLDCGYNQLQSLDFTGTNLQTLACQSNELTNLDQLTQMTGLYQLNCSDNDITALDFGQSNLFELSANNNQLTSINIKNGHEETYLSFSGNPNMQYLCCDSAQVAQYQSLVNFYGYSGCTVDNLCISLDAAAFEPADDRFSLVPNPATDRITLVAPAGAKVTKIEIYNTLGQLLMEINGNISSEIEVSRLTAGNYLMLVQTVTTNTPIRFVKR
ncbi:T9SS type A sorting domain-containing protein [Flavobacterium caeni]|uniref:Por secretion system C-terminal sorting domain-containing protein n=1 Tax=Flavobacterium caeni TaxID=490189 RepID=A0A1G5JR75_9FLAO|nr:T9SS type A sorting domain-containing protein [Flavobacterium caeni]SCY90228.1 Por secretion system C-terminal sorting domain-containing protein [Flavobacterium caeni]